MHQVQYWSMSLPMDQTPLQNSRKAIRQRGDQHDARLSWLFNPEDRAQVREANTDTRTCIQRDRVVLPVVDTLQPCGYDSRVDHKGGCRAPMQLRCCKDASIGREL